MISLCQPEAHRYPLASLEMREAEQQMRAVRDQAHKAIKHRAIHYTTIDLAICGGNHNAALLFSVLRHEHEYFSTRPNYSGFVAATIMPGERCRQSLYALCEGRLSERQLRASIERLLALGLLIRKEHANRFFRQYLWRIDPKGTTQAYERVWKAEKRAAAQERKARKEAQREGEQRAADPAPQTSKNAVFSQSDDESEAPLHGATVVSPSQSPFLGATVQETSCFPSPPFEGARNEFFSYRVLFQKTGEPSAVKPEASPVALRALSAQLEPEQQTAPSEDEQGVPPPGVGGEAPQPSREANPAVRPVEPPAMQEVALEAMIGSAAPGAALGSQAAPSKSQAASPASCETSANPDAPSLESGEASPVAANASPVEFQTDAEGGAARDPFLAGLLEGEAREGDEAARRATQEAQEAALLALAGPAPLRANVCQALRDGANFAERNGKWHLPAVRNLLARPQRPVAFKEAVRELTKELRRVKPKQRPEGTPLQLRALDSLVGLSSVQRNGLFSEPIKEGLARAEGWQRLEREEIKLAVELLPRVHVDTDPDGKEIKAVTTLIQLLDMLAGGDKPRAESTPGTPKAPPAKGAAGPNPKRLAELARRDRERLLQSEREAARKHEAEQAALLASEPETQWERARASLKMLTRGLLDDISFTQLEKRCREGLISAAELLKGLTKPGDRRAVLDAHLGAVSAGAGHLGAA